MSKRTTLWLFMVSFDLSILLLVLIHVVELELLISNEQYLFIAESVMYLTGLAALYFGWRLIDHKFPSKEKEE